MNATSDSVSSSHDGPHQGQPVAEAGLPLDEADAAIILVHGRGASARSILGLAREIDQPGVAYLAPQAAGHTWYPQSFLVPLAQNEPGLSSGLRAVDDVLARITEAGLPSEQTVLLGFSQGACLVSEYAARHPQRYGGVVALSGGLIGMGERPGETPPEDKIFDYDGDLAGTSVFFGCSDVDPHIPVERVETSAAVFEGLGADVTKRIYGGMGHTVNTDEIEFVRSLLTELQQSAA